MPAPPFTYLVTDTLNSAVAVGALDQQIRISTITAALVGVSESGGVITIDFRADLSASELAELNALVAAHDGVPLDPEPAAVAIDENEGKRRVRWEGAGNWSFGPGPADEVDYAVGASPVRLLEVVYVFDGTSWGDWITLEVVDVDNVLGGGAGALVRRIVRQAQLAPGGETRAFSSPKGIRVQGGLYLRTKIKVASALKAGATFLMREVPT